MDYSIMVLKEEIRTNCHLLAKKRRKEKQHLYTQLYASSSKKEWIVYYEHCAWRICPQV